MKTLIKYSNKLAFALALCAMVISGCSCSALKPAPDPLAGWHKSYKEEPNQAVTTDYQNYIQKLSPKERSNIAYIEYFKDGTGQHAIRIAINLKDKNWAHVLIYDKDNKRIKTIKFFVGNSAS